MKELDRKTVIVIVAVAALVIVLYIIYRMTRKALLVQRAKAELEKWRGKVETDPTMHDELVKYWEAAGFSWITPDNIQSYDNEYAWSAAFISYCVRKFYPGFPASAAHAKYTVFARERRKFNLQSMVAFEPSERKPRPGDIIVRGRGYSGDLASLYPTAKTHGDIVISNNGSEIRAIGGNIGHTVKEVSFPASNGYLTTDHFAVIKM